MGRAADREAVRVVGESYRPVLRPEVLTAHLSVIHVCDVYDMHVRRCHVCYKVPEVPI